MHRLTIRQLHACNSLASGVGTDNRSTECFWRCCADHSRTRRSHQKYKRESVHIMDAIKPMKTASTSSNDMNYTLSRSRAMLAILIAVSLGACSAGDSGGIESDGQQSAVSVRPSISAAQLANDDTRTPGYAQSVAAGVIEVTDAVNPAPVSTTDGGSGSGAGNGLPLAVYQHPDTETSSTTGDSDSESTDAPDTDSQGNATTDSGADGDSAHTGNNVVDSATTDSTGTDSGNGNTSGDEAGDTSDPAIDGDSNSTVSGGEAGDAEEKDNESDTEPAIGQAVAENFSSHTSSGFTATVDASHAIDITWLKDPTARGYNVYRDAEYITTVFEERYVDSDRYDGSYYYEIQAFDFVDNFSWWATGLTVAIEGSGRIDPNPPATNDGLLDGYELVFSDEFQSNTLDTSKWNTSYLWGPDLVINSEEQYYVDIKNEPNWGYDPFELDGEYLTIRSIPTPASLLDKANGQPYLSGVMTSYDAFQFTYGYVEARAKVPFGQGFWAAFWLLNAYYVDDKPEIDIMEHIGDDQDVVYHTYHYYDSNGELRSSESHPTPGIDYTGDFHTYAVEWKPGTIIYYVDGIERHRIVDPKVSSQDMYIIANTALGGWWPGSPNATTPFPAEYKIDYIRAYQKVGVYSDLPIFDDDTSAVPLADDVRGSSPNHMPPFELWPEGYPEKL